MSNEAEKRKAKVFVAICKWECFSFSYMTWYLFGFCLLQFCLCLFFLIFVKNLSEVGIYQPTEARPDLMIMRCASLLYGLVSHEICLLMCFSLVNAMRFRINL